MRQEKFGGARGLYTRLITEDIELCREAKSMGLLVVHDVMVGPDVGNWVLEEQRRFPGVERPLSARVVREGQALDTIKYRLADVILVPSEFTKRAVLSLGADPTKVRVVPFGISDSWLHSCPAAETGRVLFVGTVSLLKGLPYLARAAGILRSRSVPCRVRVVGPDPEHVSGNDLYAGLDFVGQVPRQYVQTEFERADVFVLPTVCDSFALVQLEAMACGVPVISTSNCGDIVRDGVDGFIVPIRDELALADRIERIVTDRDLRARMSRNARERVQQFTWERYGERLVSALHSLSDRDVTSSVDI